jgi:hypothetical protein
MSANLPPIANLQQLQEVVKNNYSGLVTLKPKAIFKAIEDLFGEPVNLNLHVPSSDIGSLTMLEATVMASLLKLLDPRVVFEIGTFLGYSTALLLRNTDSNCKVYSLDLDIDAAELATASTFSEHELRTDDVKNDNYLRYTQAAKGPYYLRNIDHTTRSRLKLLKGNSLEFNCSKNGVAGCVDLVFVDGGHEYDIIASDTVKALEMLGGNGLIIWHDYNSKIHSDVTRFLGEYSKDKLVLHVENTMLALLPVGDVLGKLISFGEPVRLSA